MKRLTTNLSDKAAVALEEAIEIGRDNQTETVNRAIQAYLMMLKADEVRVRDTPDDELEKVRFL